MVQAASSLAVCASLTVSAARAEPAPQALTFRYSPYEEDAIASAEKELAGQLDTEPEGKLIESIELVRLDPIEPRDPVPGWLNAAHTRTRENVIRRELVTQAGDRYRKVLVEESARKLRALPPITLVVCVAFRGSRADRVRLVVITKDVWSLFFDANWQFGGGRFSQLMIAPQEMNLFGLHHKVSAELNWDPYALAVGARYEIPRFEGSPINLISDSNVILDHRDDYAAEGSFGKLQAIVPLRTDQQRIAWFSSFDWRSEETRNLSSDGSIPSSYSIDKVWRTEHIRALGALTRSFGWKDKNDLTLIIDAERSDYRMPVPSGTPTADQVLQFESQILPTSFATVGPGFEWHAYTSNFLRTYELETLGLQEDYRLGHSVVVNLTPAYHVERRSYAALPDQADYRALQLGMYVGIQETVPLRDGFVRASVEGAGSVSAEASMGGPQASNPDLQRALFSASRLRNVSVKGRLRVASPRLGFGRVISDAVLTARYHDALDASDQYSNSSRLRGYDQGYPHGKDTLVANLEYRTPAAQVFTEQVGAAVFYDVAAADTGSGANPDLRTLAARSSIGAGIRVVTPLLERAGMRLDFAVPLNRSPSPFPGDCTQSKSGLDCPRPSSFAIFFTFGQAFDVGDVALTTPP